MAYRFGAHMSIAGGLYLAAERAHQAGCDCLQIFTKNNNQWNCKPLSDADCSAFAQAVSEASLSPTIAHASYLINLASPVDDLWQKSIDALVIEWQRCERLQLTGLVVHPGAYVESTPDQGIQRIVQAVQSVIEHVGPQHCRLLLENTAGQGSCLGWQIEQLGRLLTEIDSPHLGICWDTCHALAAGYDFRTARGLKQMSGELERHGVLDRLQAIHVNDSKKECGSRVDRHEHIGRGCIGDEGFRRFLRSAAFKNIPMYLETPKGIDEASGQDWDKLNLEALRRLCRARPRSPSS